MKQDTTLKMWHYLVFSGVLPPLLSSCSFAPKPPDLLRLYLLDKHNLQWFCVELVQRQQILQNQPNKKKMGKLVHQSIYSLFKIIINNLIFCPSNGAINIIHTVFRKYAWKLSVFGVFLTRIFRLSDCIRRDPGYLSVFSPNAGKYGSEKLRIRKLLTQRLFTTGL